MPLSESETRSVPRGARLTGAVAVALGLLGIAFTIEALASDHSAALEQLYVGGVYQAPYFHRILEPVSCVNLLSLALLVSGGLLAWRGRARGAQLIVGALVLEALTVLAFLGLLRSQDFATSARMGAGLALGALVPQVLLLFPLWGPLVARRNLGATTGGTSGLAAAGLLVVLLAVPAAPLPQDTAVWCSTTDDCPEGEICTPTNPSVVEECFLIIFCDSYLLYQLECQPGEIPEDTSDPGFGLPFRAPPACVDSPFGEILCTIALSLIDVGPIIIDPDNF